MNIAIFSYDPCNNLYINRFTYATAEPDCITVPDSWAAWFFSFECVEVLMSGDYLLASRRIVSEVSSLGGLTGMARFSTRSSHLCVFH